MLFQSGQNRCGMAFQDTLTRASIAAPRPQRVPSFPSFPGALAERPEAGGFVLTTVQKLRLIQLQRFNAIAPGIVRRDERLPQRRYAFPISTACSRNVAACFQSPSDKPRPDMASASMQTLFRVSTSISGASDRNTKAMLRSPSASRVSDLYSLTNDSRSTALANGSSASTPASSRLSAACSSRTALARASDGSGSSCDLCQSAGRSSAIRRIFVQTLNIATQQ